jgi:hypothetical protein
MGIYSTVELDKDELINEIRSRVPNLESFSKERLVEILEAMVQYRGYADDVDFTEPYIYNNFWPGS